MFEKYSLYFSKIYFFRTIEIKPIIIKLHYVSLVILANVSFQVDFDSLCELLPL